MILFPKCTPSAENQHICYSLVAKFVANIDRRVDSCEEYLHDLLYTRLQNMEKYDEDWADKPVCLRTLTICRCSDYLFHQDDMLQWLIDEEKKNKEFDIRNLIRMILMVNFAAIHTSSNVSNDGMYSQTGMRLTSLLSELYPRALPSRRQPRVRGPSAQRGGGDFGNRRLDKGRHGKDAQTGQLHARVPAHQRHKRQYVSSPSVHSEHNLTRLILILALHTPASLLRTTLRDIRFSDGTLIPADTLIVAAATAMHLDGENYTDPEVFNPWRFSDMRQEEGGALKHQFVSTALDYVSFGHGKHAWYVQTPVSSACRDIVTEARLRLAAPDGSSPRTS